LRVIFWQEGREGKGVDKCCRETKDKVELGKGHLI
jgi:hypothetical protein